MRILIPTLTLLLSTLFASLSLPASAAIDTPDLSAHFAQRMQQHPVLRAEFIQQKQMAAFKKPLVTNGRLVYLRNEGVIWKLEAPIKLAYIMTDRSIVEIGEDGKANVRNAKDVPGIEQVGRVFRSLLGAQSSAVSDLFTVSSTGALAAWQMTLTPKPGPLNQFMTQIQLNGGRNVDQIFIDETNGDKTTITFRNTTESGSLTPEEQALFGVQK